MLIVPVIALLAMLAGPTVEAGQFEIRPVVQPGAPAPGGGTFTGFGEVQINDRGAVLFEALVGERRGLFLAADGQIAPVAVQGEPTPLGGRYLQLSYFVLNDQQEVAFVATILRGPQERHRPPAVIMLGRAGQLGVIAKVRDPAPVRGTYKEFRDLALDGSGRLAFYASLGDGDRPGGIFLHDGAGPGAWWRSSTPRPSAAASRSCRSRRSDPEGPWPSTAPSSMTA